MNKETPLVVFNTKENTLQRFSGKRRTHHVRPGPGAVLDAETIEIFRKYPEYLLDDDDDDAPTAA